ncbi:MAG: YHS domain-containing (seleno)protein [Pseudomonadota bacterium]
MTIFTRRTAMIGGAALVAGAGAAYALTGGLGGWEELEYAKVYAEDGVAIRGTDPVSYFEEGAPRAGDPSITAEWSGATWRFASAENRDKFLADPAAYAPQYGGFCAWAVAEKGQLFSTDPDAWAIVDGKLYLNYNADIQKRWEVDMPGFIAEGDRRWPTLSES